MVVALERQVFDDWRAFLDRTSGKDAEAAYTVATERGSTTRKRRVKMLCNGGCSERRRDPPSASGVALPLRVNHYG